MACSSPELTLEITGRQGRVFEGKKTCANDEEDFLGGIAYDGQTVWFAEEDGIMNARLVSPTELEVVYIHEAAETDLIAIIRYERPQPWPGKQRGPAACRGASSRFVLWGRDRAPRGQSDQSLRASTLSRSRTA